MIELLRNRLLWQSLTALLCALPAGCGTPAFSMEPNRQGPAVAGENADRATGAAPRQRRLPVADETPTVRTAAASGVGVRGKVLFDGPAPQRQAINMSKDAACKKIHGDKPVLSENLIVSDDGGVKNAFIYVRRGAPKIDYPLPDAVVELDQKGCMYQPRVQGMRAGQKLKVLNSDPVTHNVRSFPVRNRAFNFGQPADSGPRERVLDAAEPQIEIQCDIHPWMHAYLFVLDHPYFAVSDDAGNWSIEGLPPGQYSLAIWHEELGKQQQNVTVADKPLDGINFTFKP